MARTPTVLEEAGRRRPSDNDDRDNDDRLTGVASRRKSVGEPASWLAAL